MKRIMIAGTGSGCGKTSAVCGIMKALSDRGMKIASFKCGPDYIDPMFHSKVIGADSFNLDSFFCTPDMIKRSLDLYGGESDIAVIEGVMGFYDGGDSSSHALSLITESPVIIVINSAGMSTSMGAVMKGFLTFYGKNNIIGFIFSRLPDSQIKTAKELCAEMNVKYFGRIPKNGGIAFESRNLGLVTPDGIKRVNEKISALGRICEEELLLDEIIAAAEEKPLSCNTPALPKYRAGVRIAVSRDSAFCFYYSENIRLLESLGAETVYFSPLDGEALPENVSGLILCGGYPELYIKRLSDNVSMRESVKRAVESGLPCIAECGGFMYLHKNFICENGDKLPLAGVVPGDAFMTGKLNRFGYITLTAEKDNVLCGKGETLKAHEYHYGESTAPGSDFTAVKRNGGVSYGCIFCTDNLIAGFPHFYFPSDPETALRFVKCCERYDRNGKDQKNNPLRQERHEACGGQVEQRREAAAQPGTAGG